LFGCYLCCSVYCLCVNVYCHRVTTQLQLINILLYYIILIITSASVLGHLQGPHAFFDACSLFIQRRNTRYLNQNSGTILFEESLNIDVGTQKITSASVVQYCTLLFVTYCIL